MSSYSGYINYVEYVAGIDKGATKRGYVDENGDTQGSMFNSPFGLGKVDPTYTSSRVVEERFHPSKFFPIGSTRIVREEEGW